MVWKSDLTLSDPELLLLDPYELVGLGLVRQLGPLHTLLLVGVLVGLKTVVNEFVAYDRLIKLKPYLSSRSVAISTYALCGFSNPASIGI